MPTISRRLRIVLRPTAGQSDDLEAVRARTREVLNRPYNFEPKTFLKPWEIKNDDPFVSLFKPFGKVLALPNISTVSKTKTQLMLPSWTRFIPLALLIVAAAFLFYQVFLTSFIASGSIISNVKTPSLGSTVSTPSVSIPSASIPNQTSLQPGGPYNDKAAFNPNSSSLSSTKNPTTNLIIPSTTSTSSKTNNAPSSQPVTNSVSTNCSTGSTSCSANFFGLNCTKGCVLQHITPLPLGITPQAGYITDPNYSANGIACTTANPCLAVTT